MTDPVHNDEPYDTPAKPPRRKRNMMLLGAAALLAVGGGAGAVAVQTTRPSVTMAPLVPVAIRSLGAEGIVTIRGQVAEIYGNKFVIADASGRALVDTGRAGEDGALVKPGEPVTVQGRFDRGFIRAAFLVAPGGKVTALGPLGGPPHGPGGPDGPDGPGRPHGPRDDRGPRDGRDGPPPPPPGATAQDDAGRTPPPPPAGAPAPVAGSTTPSAN